MTTIKEIALEMLIAGLAMPALVIAIFMALGQFLALSRLAS